MDHGPGGRAGADPLVVARGDAPVLVGNRICARVLPKSGHPELVCLELDTGKKVWQRGQSGDIVSDPLVVRGRLFAVVVDPPQGPMAAQVMLVEWGLDTGEVLQRRPLFELQSEWAAQQACQAAVAGDRIVAALAGSLFCLDPREQLYWLRQSASVPPVDGGLARPAVLPSAAGGRRAGLHRAAGCAERSLR